MIGSISTTNAAATAWQARTTSWTDGSALVDGSCQSTHRGGRPPGPPPGGPGRLPPEATSSAAEALGLSEDEVTSALSGGSTLCDLASAQGVDLDALIEAVAQGLSTDGPGRGRSVEELRGVATHMVNGEPPPPPPVDAERDRSQVATRAIDSTSELGLRQQRAIQAFLAAMASSWSTTDTTTGPDGDPGSTRSVGLDTTA